MKNNIQILFSTGASFQEKLAAKELRRYFYLRTKYLPKLCVTDQIFKTGMQIVISTANGFLASEFKDIMQEQSMDEQEYRIKTIHLDSKHKVLAVIGGGPTGALYGAYKLLEILGVRFYLHGDTIPDERISVDLPEVDEQGKPLFELRGIVPFHDFPEGPDWWELDDYLAVIGQLPKLRMNFFGLHTYPEKFDRFAGAEPAVWIGTSELVEKGGHVKRSYASRHFTTLNDRWGYVPKKTGDFRFGADQLFEHEVYAAQYMLDLAPNPSTPGQSNELFNRFGDLLRSSFTYAGSLGIKTCVGTEIPMTIPIALKKYLQEKGKNPEDHEVVREVYEGIFKRIMQTHPLDYYWLWTHEYWIRGNTELHEQEVLDDLYAAVSAAQQAQASFTLATSGWVLGPKSDRAKFDRHLPKDMPIGTLNGSVGFTPVDPAFSEISGRPKWTLPWIEDDGAMILPQLWVGRIRRDAADSLIYGCNGMMANHWRTRVVGPNIGALSAAGWEQRSWSPYTDKELALKNLVRTEGPIGGKSVSVQESDQHLEDALYDTARVGVSSYSFNIASGTYDLTLMFGDHRCVGEDKSIFSIDIQGKQRCERLDLSKFQGPFTLQIKDVKIFQNVLKIDFVPIEGNPVISGIVIDGSTFDFNQIKGKPLIRKLNCGGPSCLDFEAELPDYQPGLRSFAADDFYLDWSHHEFGQEAAESIASIFSALDGKLPRPAEWGPGPGGRIIPNREKWERVSLDYRFVDSFAALRPQIIGRGNLERFDYWLNQFRYLMAVGHTGCLLGQYETEEDREKEKYEDEETPKANQQMILLQGQIINKLAEMSQYLMAAVRTKGELGTMANIQTQAIELLYQRFEQSNPDLPKPEPLKLAIPGPGIVVPTVRTSLQKGEPLQLKVLMLDKNITQAFFYWRPLGSGEFSSLLLSHIGRSVYTVVLDEESIKDDFEYYIQADSSKKVNFFFPATAPEINQTVIILPDESYTPNK